MGTMKFLLQLTGRSVLIWLTTNLIGSVLATFILSSLYGSIEMEEAGLVIVFSLIFSSPVILVMIFNLLVLTRIPSLGVRVVYAVLSTMAISMALLISLFSIDVFMPDDSLVMFYSPFILSAVGMVLLFARKIIFFPGK